MKRMMSSILLLSTCFTIHAYAAKDGAYISISPSSSGVTFPENITVAHEALSDYTLKNNWDNDITVTVNTPAGFTRETPNEAPFCNISSDNTVTIPQGQSCDVRYAYTPTTVIDNQSFTMQACAFGTACTNYKQVFNVVSQPVDHSPILSVKAHVINLSSGETNAISVTNISENPANNVQLSFDKTISDHLVAAESILSAPIIQPHQTVVFKATGDLNLGVDTTSSPIVTIAGSNTQPFSTSSKVLPTLVTASSLQFKKIGQATITITNPGQTPLTNFTVTPGAGITGIGVDDTGIEYPCREHKDNNGICQIGYSVSSTAQGSAIYTMTFQVPDGQTKTITTNVALPRPKIIINPDAQNQSQPIAFNASGGTITLKNITPFTGNDVSINIPSSAPWIQITNPNACATIAGNATCNLTYASFTPPSSNSTTDEYASKIEATVKNIPTSSTAGYKEGAGLQISLDEDSNDEHLFYRAVRITNTDKDKSHAWSNGSFGLPTSVPIELCSTDSSDTTCLYHTTCSASMTLANGESCLIWYKAKEGNETAFTSNQTDTANVSITLVDQSTLTLPITFNYGFQLYAGGTFTENGDKTPMNYIARYNGSTWSALVPTNGTGLATNANYSSNIVDAITKYRGDLIVGGNFADANNAPNTAFLARWTGNQWEAVDANSGTSEPAGPVSALAKRLNRLFISGGYTDEAGNYQPYLSHYNASTGIWQDIIAGSSDVTTDNSIMTLAVNSNDTLFIGGQFTKIGNLNATYLAQWNSSDATFRTVPDNVSSDYIPNNIITMLYNVGTDVFVGGYYSNFGGVSGWRGLADYVPSFGFQQLNNTSAPQGSYQSMGHTSGYYYTGGIFYLWDENANESSYGLYQYTNAGGWKELGLESTGYVEGIVPLGDNIYVGGEFTSMDNINIHHVGYIPKDGAATDWKQLGSGLGDPDNNNEYVSAMMAMPDLSLSTSSMQHH